MADGVLARDVAAVVIGRNEGERLAACLDSLRGRVGRIIYVDSGSMDGSAAAAAARGSLVVPLTDDVAFSAARARNAGAAAAAAADPEGRCVFLLFVDGDCRVDPGWPAAARAALERDPSVAVVCGRRRELLPDVSIYNRLCDMEWNTPVGSARSCGGDAMMRRAAFEAVGGFDPGMIAGEEPELCVRLRAAGWTVQRIDVEMTLHDAAIHHFGQWWRRALRSGWAYAEGAARHGAPPERHNVQQMRSIALWGAAMPAGIVLMLGAAVLSPAPMVAGAVGLAALYPAMAVRIAWRRRAQFGDPWAHAALYGAFTMLAKPVQALGALKRLRDARAGRGGRIIEYKSAS